MNTFGLIRYNVELPPESSEDWNAWTGVAVPLIDGVPLSEMLHAFPGVDVELVAPPSRHWLGDPEHVEWGRPVVLDGGCSVAGCCGVVARITIARENVRWDDFYSYADLPIADDLNLTFDRREYEAAIENVRAQPATPWVFRDD